VKQFGLTSTCDFVNPNRLQCNFPAISRTAQIQYVSMQCGSTGAKISLDLFQLLAVPPNNTTFGIGISNSVNQSDEPRGRRHWQYGQCWLASDRLCSRQYCATSVN
jgi:hypothetical protein